MDYSHVLSIPSPSYSLNQVEISYVKRLWASLDIISIGSAPSSVVHPTISKSVSNNSASSTVSRRSSFHSLNTYTSSSTVASGVSSKSSSTTAKNSTSTNSNSSSGQTLPTLQYNLSNLRHFQSKLCTKILQLEQESNPNKTQVNSTSSRLELFDLFKLAPLQFHAIEANYQVIQMLQLISIMINCVEFNRTIPEAYIKYSANLNSRLYNMNRKSYAIFGEALILSIIEYLSERSLIDPTAKRSVGFEEQLSFNNFVSQLLNQLVEHANDPSVIIPMVDMPELNKKIGNNTSIPKAYTYETNHDTFRREPPIIGDSNVRTSYSEISVKSSRLSLYSPSELDFDLTSLDEVAIIRSKTRPTNDSDNDNDSETTVNGLQPEKAAAPPVRIDEESEESSESDDNDDDVYDMINAFGDDLPKVEKKKSKLSFFRRSISGPKQVTPAGRENRLRRVTSNISFVH